MDTFKFRSEICIIREFITQWVATNRISFDPETEAIKWSKNRQSIFIESILLNIPIPVFYLHEDKHGDCTTLDGGQRLYIIYNFMMANMKLRFSTKNRLQGMYFKDFAKTERKKIENYPLTFHILYDTTTEVILDIMRRIS